MMVAITVFAQLVDDAFNTVLIPSTK